MEAAMAMATPGRHANVITKHLVDAATERFLARVEAFEASEDDEVDTEEKVVRGVTLKMLERVSERLFKGTSCCLRDGTLFITEVKNNIHSIVHPTLGSVLLEYARANDLIGAIELCRNSLLCTRRI